MSTSSNIRYLISAVSSRRLNMVWWKAWEPKDLAHSVLPVRLGPKRQRAKGRSNFGNYGVNVRLDVTITENKRLPHFLSTICKGRGGAGTR